MNLDYTERQTLVYDTLCDLYGTDAVDFFTNVLGMQICADEDVYQELVDMGVLDDDADENDDEDWDNENEY